MLYRDYLKSKYQNTAVKLANAEGVPCALEYSKGKNMRNYEVYGNSVQDGTPSPESPVEIQSVGDLTTKNLFDKEACHCYEIKSEPPTVIDINTYAAGVLWSDQLISLFKPNTTYTISCEFECVDAPSDDYTFNNGILGFLIQPKVSGYSSINMLVTHQLVKGEIYHFSKTFTIPSNFSEGTYVMYVYRNSYKNSDGKSITASAICRNIQIEEGSTATEYEPYHKYDIPITVCGKNLLPYPYIYTTKTINGVTFTDNGDGSITIDGTATANAVFYLVGKQDNYTLDKCGLKIGDSYTISKTLSSGDSIANVYFTANYYNENGKMQEGVVISNSNTATKTIKSDFKSWGIYLLVLKDKTVNNTTIKLQLEKGSSATEHEPYKGGKTTHIYLDEPLRKVGDYADYIDFKNQKVVRKVKHREFSSNNNWSVYLSAANHFQIIVGDNYFAQVEGVKVMSNYYPQYSGRYYSITSLDYAVLSVDGSRLRFRDIRYTTLDEWKAFLDTLETPLAVNYILATPTEENISLPALKTFKGTSVMSVDTAVLPSNIKAKYIRT